MNLVNQPTKSVFPYQPYNLVIEAHDTTSLYITENQPNGSPQEYIIHCKRKSHVTIIYRLKKESVYRTSIIVILEEPDTHATVMIEGEYTNDADILIHTFQNHIAPHTSSRVIIKGIVRDQANIKVESTVFIATDAQQAKAHQKSAFLLLSDHAQAHSRPSLEVLNNQVACGHGSSIGKLDPESLWYLSLRGCTQDQAKNLLIKAFLLANF